MAQEWKDKVVFMNVKIVPVGEVAVKFLLAEGIKHLTILDINEEAGKSLRNELSEKYGDKVKFIKCDASDDDLLMKSYQAVLEEQGYIDVVVNYTVEMNDSKEGFKNMINMNFTSLVSSTLKSIEIMSKENGGTGGTIINFTSVCALVQSHLLPIYFATKCAILQFSNSIGRQEYYSRTGVRIITLALGSYDLPIMKSTKSFDKTVEASLADALSKFPMQRIESIAQGLSDAFKVAESGSTWLSTSDRPIQNITASIKKAYDLMSVHVFE